MSSTQPTIDYGFPDVDYPESDGQPMGETDWHIDAMIRIKDILRQRYLGQRVYVSSNLLVYYEEGNPRRFIVPDVFLVQDCDPGPRRIFKTWQEKRSPDVVFEITSRSTAREDAVLKPAVYEQIGVRELFLYDPTAEYLDPPLRGFRLRHSRLMPLERRGETLHSEVLNVELSLDGQRLKMTDSASGEALLTEAEALRAEVKRLRAQHDD